MCWRIDPALRLVWPLVWPLVWGVTILLFLIWFPAHAREMAGAQVNTPGANTLNASTGNEDSQVWLVTYGPGEVYWQRFGHNAIWVRDRELGLDHVFNFGFFDFAQEDFLLRFLQGRMLYFSAAQPATDEFAGYIDENRSIRAQRLDLPPGQAAGLTAFLLNEVRPENRDYLYDYYRNNCSTRVRDALDLALGGALSGGFSGMPAEWNWRDHTRRLTAADFWLYLGLEIALGAPVDRATDRWQEMFIPEVLADGVAAMPIRSASGSAPLVLEDVVLYASTLPPPPASPQAWWPRYLLASLVLVGTILAGLRLPGRRRARRWCTLLSRAWFGLAGLAGLILLFLWFGTDHAVARLNLNLLVFCPLWLWPALSRSAAGRTLPLVAGLSALALVMPFLPPGQYNLDVLAAFLPLNLVAAIGVDAARRVGGSRDLLAGAGAGAG